AALDAGRRQRVARLAHPCRTGAAVDRSGEAAVRRGRSWSGPGQHRLCAGFDDHRSVPVGLSVGAFPVHQIRRENAHAARFARQHPKLHPPLGRQTGRCPCPRPADPGAIYVIDRGYVDFARLHTMHRSGAFFVTRAKSNLNFHRRYSAPTDRTTGIICDQTIALDGHDARQHYPERLRRVRCRDAETSKTLVFLTNNFDLPALTIAALYKNRWQVELFFKWIKQHLRIKQFYGTSENAVKTQIWIAVSVYVLVTIVKQRLGLEASLYTLMQVLSVTIFEKMPLQTALSSDQPKSDTSMDSNQLNLFGF